MSFTIPQLAPQAAPAVAAPAHIAPAQEPTTPVQEGQPSPEPAQPVPAAVEPAAMTLPPIEQVSQAQVNATDTYLSKAGISTDHVAAEMQKFGKLSEMTTALLRQAHGEHADLIIANVEHTHTQLAAQEAKAESEAHGIVAELLGVDAAQGGAEMSKVVSWAVNSLPENEVAELAELIDRGGIASKLALQQLVTGYSQGNSQPANLVAGDVRTNTNAVHMTRDEYNRQRFEIEDKFGYNSQQMVALQNQRTQAINNGY